MCVYIYIICMVYRYMYGMVREWYGMVWYGMTDVT